MYGGKFCGFYNDKLQLNLDMLNLIKKADIIIVFEPWMKYTIQEYAPKKRVIVFDIEDKYVTDQLELRNEIKKCVLEHPELRLWRL
jgi:predicted protein tyrosine phosphatase